MAIQLKVGVFSTAAAFIMVSFAMPYLPKDTVGHGPGNIIEFNTEFNGQSTKEAKTIVEKFNHNNDAESRLLIKLMSPGGEVVTGKDLQASIKRGKHIDTYVSSMAASMGASTFMLGERRYVDEDAIVLFHGAHGGNFIMSQPVLTKLIEILEQLQKQSSQESVLEPTPKTESSNLEIARGGKRDSVENSLEAVSKEPVPVVISPKLAALIKNDISLIDVAPLAQKLLAMVEQQGFAVVLHDLRSIRDMLKGTNETMVARISATLMATDASYTPDKVRKDLFANFERDMVFTGRQLVEMGVATKLGEPPESDYS